MPIRGYFEPQPRVGMSWARLPAGLGTGIKVTGAVLEGRMSVEEAILLDRIRAGSDPLRRQDPGPVRKPGS